MNHQAGDAGTVFDSLPTPTRLPLRHDQVESGGWPGRRVWSRCYLQLVRTAQIVERHVLVPALGTYLRTSVRDGQCVGAEEDPRIQRPNALTSWPRPGRRHDPPPLLCLPNRPILTASSQFPVATLTTCLLSGQCKWSRPLSGRRCLPLTGPMPALLPPACMDGP